MFITHVDQLLDFIDRSSAKQSHIQIHRTEDWQKRQEAPRAFVVILQGGESMPTLGKFIRRRRTELGLTQEELADLIGDNTRQADISRLENDRVSLPRRARLEAIAKALQVSPGLLLAKSGWEGGEEIDPPSDDDIASRVDRLRTSLPDQDEPFEEHHQVIAEALPAMANTISQVRDLIDEAEHIIDETQSQVDSLKKNKAEG